MAVLALGGAAWMRPPAPEQRPVAQFAEEGKGLEVLLQGLLEAAQPEVGHGQADQRDRLAGPVTDGTEGCEGPLEVVAGLLEPADPHVADAE